MSTVRYFDDVPHIVRYGMQSEKTEESWMLFWRNGKKFKISIHGADIRDTAFYQAWRPFITEPRTFEERRPHLKQWDPFCDLILSHSLNRLAELAPVQPYWTTFHDYLHSPLYNLKIIAKPGSTDEVETIQTDGPVDKPAYEFRPIPMDTMETLPSDLPRFDAGDLTVLNREKNWRMPPYKLRTPEGKGCYLQSCN